MEVFCPYCDEEIGDAIYTKWNGDYTESFVLNCPKCGKELDIGVQHCPDFSVDKKEM